MANQNPTPGTSLSHIDANETRYPRPRWFRNLRFTLTMLISFGEFQRGPAFQKTAVILACLFNFMFLVLITTILSSILSIFNAVQVEGFQLFILTIITLSIPLSIFLTLWALRDERREKAVLLERERKHIETLEELPSPGFKLRHKLEGHAGWLIKGIAWSLDGDTLASWSSDQAIRLWNTQTGQLIIALTGGDSVSSVAWSPDGKILAAGSCDNLRSLYAIKLWNARTGEHFHTFSGHSAWIQTVAWSPDGKMLASGSYDKTIRFWDVQTANLCIQALAGSVTLSTV